VHLVLSAEGSSDLGKLSYGSNAFVPASMYYLIDKIIEKKLGYSFYELTPELITFIPKVELVKIGKKLPPYTSKKIKKGQALFLVNSIALAKVAKKRAKELEDDDVIAILFRDSDGTNSTSKGMWEDKIESIENGFKMEKFTKGIAMIPKPKSEAWLICALKDKPYQQCKKLEDRSGNDDSPHNLKDELTGFDIELDVINEMIQDGRIEIEKIDMPSFRYFETKLKELL
jgi:hypothetical protein